MVRILMTPMVVMLTLGIACTVAAELTTAEIDALRHAHTATIVLTTDVDDDLNVLLGSASAVLRGLVSAAVVDHLIAVRAVIEGNSLLLGADVGVAAFASPVPGDRLVAVATAWVRYDRALTYIGRAQTGAALARAACTIATCTTSASKWLAGLTNGASLLGQVRRDLSYLFPRPTDGVFIVGPHGNYDEATWWIGRGQMYGVSAMDALVAAYRLTSFPDGDYLNLVPIVHLFRIFAIGTTGQFSLAGVLNTEQDPFFRALAVLRALTTADEGGLPKLWGGVVMFRLYGFTRHLGTVSVVYDALVQTAIQRIGDGWMRTDMGAWMLMVFPDCSILQNPAGCGGL